MWPTVKLKSLGFIQGNGVDKTINRDELSIKLLNYMDVYTYTVIDNKLNFQEVTAKKNKIKKCNLIESDVLFTPSSETPDDIAHASVVVEDLENVVYSYHVIRFRFHEKNKIDKYFLRYCLNQYSVQKYFTSRASGTTRYTLSKKDFENLSFQIPTNKQEQKAIATILSKVDEAIESTKQTINSAQKLKTSLMQNLLTGKIKPDGTKRKDDEFYYDEKLGKVPKGWDVKNISNPTICKINPNYSIPKTTNEFPFLPMDAINDKFNGIGKIERISGSLSGYTKFKKHDILFAKITPSTENGKVALVDIEEEFEVGFASTEFLVFQPNQDFVEPKFLYYKLIKNDIHFLAVSLMEGTSGRQRVPWKIFRNRVFSAFPIDKNEQKAIADKISEIDNIITIKQNKIEKLENLKKSLMQNLLTGKMRLDEKLIKELISHV